MAHHRSLMAAHLDRARQALDRVDLDAAPSVALPHVRESLEALTEALDEAMALALVEDDQTIRAVAGLAGLSENAVGPRLSRTQALGAYAQEGGRVTSTGVTRARLDAEAGDPRPAPAAAPPLRFRARRPTS